MLVEDDDRTPRVDESDDKSVVKEGETAEFLVELSRAVSSDVEVSYETSDVTAVSEQRTTRAVSATTLTFTAGTDGEEDFGGDDSRTI